MASPQVENGFTKIANELYDALVAWHLSSYEFRVFLYLIRKTYGWEKKEDWVSLSQFVLGTKIRESHVSRALGQLLKQNMVTKRGNPQHPIWGVQKDFDKWIRLPKGVRCHKTLTKRGNQPLPKGGDTKETITKERIQAASPQGEPMKVEEPWDYERALQRMATGEKKEFKILSLFLRVKGYQYENREQLQSAVSRHIKAARALMGYPPDQIKRAMEYCIKKHSEINWTLETVGKAIDYAK